MALNLFFRGGKPVGEEMSTGSSSTLETLGLTLFWGKRNWCVWESKGLLHFKHVTLILCMCLVICNSRWCLKRWGVLKPFTHSNFLTSCGGV